MQIQLSQRMLLAWRKLSPEARLFVESLKVNPRPAEAKTVPGRPNRYEEFIDDFWIVWVVDDSTGETIVRVTVSE